ncbi:MAG: site-specific integrase [Desulfobacterales bacterium]|nr:site-specific integrase [Desulfobacterales bacterium]
MGVGKRGNTLVIDFRCYLPDGRRVRCVEREGKETATNLKRVKQKCKAIEYHIGQGTFNYLRFFPHGSKAKQFTLQDQSQITYAEFRTNWVEELAIRKGTEDNYTYPYKNYIKPYFGHWHLSDITEHEIKVFRKKLLERGLKPSTVNQYIKVFCMPLKDAAKQGFITQSPCEEIRKVKESKAHIDPFTFDELKHLLNSLKEKDPEWHDLVLFWSRTGVRPGELMALRWESVDFFNKQVLICATRNYYGGDGPPKTEASDREIHLRPVVTKALKRQQVRTGMLNKWVFLNPRQGQWTMTSFRDAFKYQLRLVGLKIRPPKQMRHTFATLHIGAGESISWVSKTLGHSSVEITLNRYNRFIPNLTREDGSAFERVLNGNNLVTPRHNILKS